MQPLKQNNRIKGHSIKILSQKVAIHREFVSREIFVKTYKNAWLLRLPDGVQPGSWFTSMLTPTTSEGEKLRMMKNPCRLICLKFRYNGENI